MSTALVDNPGTRVAAPAKDPPAAPAGPTALTASAGGGGGGGSPAGGTPDGIGGMPALKGLILYGATLTFAGLYGYFMVKIFGARPGHPPALDATLVTAAAGLAGVLGSAFALEIGSATQQGDTNPALEAALGSGSTRHNALANLRRAVSLEPSAMGAASWPKTFGIWTYAVVGTAVAVTYIVNQGQTPNGIRALAVVFAGYVLALINAAYTKPKAA